MYERNEELLEGDEFEAVYDHYARLLLSLATTRFAIPAEDAESLVQDVFIAYLRHTPIVPDPRAWLVGALANRARHYLREKINQPEVAIEEIPPEYEPAVTPIEVTLLDLVRDLPDLERSLLLMKFVEGLTTREIADRLKRPYSSVASTLFRALKTLRDDIAHRGTTNE